MSNRICKNTSIKSCTIDALPNIPLLPWGHRICNKDISNCDNFPVRPFSRFKISKWKTGKPITAIIPTNSRPLPQPTKWVPPHRPLPDLTVLEQLVDQNLINPRTGQYIQTGNSNTINHTDYLLYNNPNPYFDSSYNLIWCNTNSDNSDLTEAMNFYSGPGWKRDRVHGNKFRALSRPLKHWRKQLFPRQFIDANGQPAFDQESAIDISVSRRGRSGIGSSIFDIPNGYFKTDNSYLNSDNKPYYIENNQVSCIPIYVKDLSNILIINDEAFDRNNKCDLSFNLCTQSFALQRARPGNNQTSSNFQFQSNRGYLQARVKLHHQRSTFSYNPYTFIKETLDFEKKFGFPPQTISLYSSHRLIFFDPSQTGIPNSCYSKNCHLKCAIEVSYKPRNKNFQRDYAVSSKNNIRRKSRIATTRNQYNITNTWGVSSAHDSLYNNCINPLRLTNIRQHRTLVCDNIP